MTTELTVSDITVTIPALGDSANIVTAFTDYHTDMSAAVAVLGRATNTFTGDIAINGGDATTTATTFNLINTNAITVNFAGAGTGITIGASGSGTTTLRNTTVAMAGAATVGTTLGVSGATTLSSTLSVTGNTTLTGDLAVNGGDLTSSASTFNLLASPGTVNIASAGTAVTIGATTGETTVRNDLVLGTAKKLIFEGATANDFETAVTVADPTADRTITFPDVDGIVVTTGDSGSVTNAMLTGSIADTKLSTIATANKVSLTALNIDGATDIGAALVDGDLFIVDDGATGTNRKLQASRIKTYIFSNMSDAGDVSINDTTGALTINPNSVELGTDTTGDYVAGITQSAGISVANSGGEGSEITIGLSHLGIQNLLDPNADRILFWDDSAGATAWLTVSTGLSLSGTTLTNSGVTSIAGTANEITASPSDGAVTLSLPDTINANIKGNVTSDATTNGKVTFSNTSGTTYTPVGKIFVQATQPASPATGDIWIDT